MHRSFLFRLLGLLTVALSFASAQAQDNPAKNFPDKPIRVIVAFAAGGANDLVARVLGQKLTESLGQAVVVENKPGASGAIAAMYAAKAKPDGYTLFFASSGTLIITPAMSTKLAYSSSDYVPISMVATFPLFIVVNPSQPFQSIKDLVEYLKANPKKANFAGAGGSHQIAFELFKSQTGTAVEYIPYKGTNQSVAAVMAGDVLMSMADAAGVAGQLKGGQVRGLAVTSRERAVTFPSIPTVAEAGYPGLQMGSWMGLLAPADTPMPIVRKLQAEVNRIVKTADFKQRMNALELTPEGSTSEEFGQFMTSELVRIRAVVKAANIQPTD